ncbi:expressed unknown protein [Ectocarpus siliculosus]|uniref:Uncharacterized protein n=1 Tax=Ectocarpus siliculosus TaxID=2880 RepID=D7G4X1_ECTSI|nr:expressed unknown protein [Ectocarpus siliculosus]|eukprot:CBJ27214.1 expressed unknown protein [Ectocarpus siliculosus]
MAARTAEAVAPSDAATGRINSKCPADKRPDAEPTARSSPESEDIYTDLWLTGIPWATSSPPNVENLELEMPVAPAPLDALRSDDRGSRDDDDEEEDSVREATLFMHQEQAASLVQGKEPRGGSRVGFAPQEPPVVHMSSKTAVDVRTATSRDGGERVAGHVSGTQEPPPCRGACTPANTEGVIASEKGLPVPLSVSTGKCGQRDDSSGVPEGAPGCLGDGTSIVTRKPGQMTGPQAGLSELGPPLADGAETVPGPAHAPHPPPPPPPVATGAADTTAPGALQENTHLSPPISPSTPPTITQPIPHQKLSPNADKPTAATASLPVWALLPPALPGLDVTASPSYPQSGPRPASSIDTVPADAGGSNTTALAGSARNAAATTSTSNSPSSSPRSAPSSTQAPTTATKSGTTDGAGDAEQAAPITDLVGAAMACGARVSPSASGPCPTGQGKISGAQAESSPSAPKLSPAASLASSGWTAEASKSWTCAGGTSRNAADSKHDGTESLQGAVLREGPSSRDVRPCEKVSTSRGRSDDGDGRRGDGPGPSAR